MPYALLVLLRHIWHDLSPKLRRDIANAYMSLELLKFQPKR